MKLKIDYNIIITKDGSPTLRMKTTNNEESMHSHSGAFKETIYVYGEAFDRLPSAVNYKVLSVGLGLGYNEILSVCKAIVNKKTENFYLESYEKEEFLILQFKNWINNQATPLSPIYNQILNLFSQHYDISEKEIKHWLSTFLISEKIKLKKSLGFTTHFGTSFHITLFDAFCSKTSPELWNDNFLEFILKNSSNRVNNFATYASKSSLKKILQNEQYNLLPKVGFAGKRESTLAVRN